jgi:hypothetical protein
MEGSAKLSAYILEGKIYYEDKVSALDLLYIGFYKRFGLSQGIALFAAAEGGDA